MSGAARARAAFESTFGGAPEGVWAAPGRVNLIGEHTDYNEGLALPLAIEQSAFVAARRRADARVCLCSMQAGRQELTLEALGPGHVRGWAAYVAGVAWAALEEGARGTGLDLLLDGEVPPGAGLSSSAAVECASCSAIAELWGLARSPLELAHLARRAEAEVVGVPCGLLDQLTSMLAREGHALAIDFRSLAVEPVPLPLAATGLSLLVIDTRSPHQLADGAYAERRQACESAARALGLGSLREATLSALPELERRDPLLARRARHVVGENARVGESLALLRAASAGAATRLHELGPLLSASHRSLRDDFEVSSPRLDVAAESAESAGALGARLVGGGFGGSVLALVRSAELERVSAAVASAYAARGWEPPRWLRAVPAAGARRVL